MKQGKDLRQLSDGGGGRLKERSQKTKKREMIEVASFRTQVRQGARTTRRKFRGGVSRNSTELGDVRPPSPGTGEKQKISRKKCSWRIKIRGTGGGRVCECWLLATDPATMKLCRLCERGKAEHGRRKRGITLFRP